jgi:hypothetical protein
VIKPFVRVPQNSVWMFFTKCYPAGMNFVTIGAVPHTLLMGINEFLFIVFVFLELFGCNSVQRTAT